MPEERRQTSLNYQWTEILKAVALEVLGQPTERRGTEWRYGRRLSMVVNVGGPRGGTWRDFEAGHGGGALELLRHHQGLDKAQALEWLRARGLLQDNRPGAPGSAESRATVIACSRDGRNRENAGTEQASRPTSDVDRRLGWAKSWWDGSQQIPTSPDHPARRWISHRKLWRPELPLPSSVRWTPATGEHTGAGSIVALAAPPVAWAAAWPGLPDAAAVQLVHVDDHGQPALDRRADKGGLEKQTVGAAQGAAVVLGNPRLPEASALAHVAEDLANALALASRFEGTAIAALGPPGMMGQDQLLAQWLAGATHGVRVHCDAADPKHGSPPAGRRAAAMLMVAVNGRRRRGSDRPSGPRLQGLRRAVRPGAGPRPAAGRVGGLRQDPPGNHRLAALGDRPGGHHRPAGAGR